MIRRPSLSTRKLWKGLSAFICVYLRRAPFALVLAALAASAQAADPKKVIRYASPSAESKLDPAAESDEASGSISHVIFDPLLTYDFLARPAKLKPNSAVALPEVADEGATYTLRIKPGIYFTPDPAFGGKKRELTAHDYVYSMKRLFDPKLRSQWLFLVEGKIRGGDAAMARAKQTGKFDFDAPMEGLQALDRYTVRIRLVTGDYSFPYVLAMPATAALAREYRTFGVQEERATEMRAIAEAHAERSARSE